MTVRRAIGQTLLARQATFLVAAVSVVVLARLLRPEEFGLFAIAAAAHVAAATMAGFGLKWRLVRAATPDPEETGAAVGLHLALSAGAALALAAGAAAAPALGAPEGLSPPLLVFAAALLLGPIIMPLEVELERELSFGALSMLAVAQSFVHATTAIALALSGAGPAALAAGLLAERTLTAAVLLARRGRGPFPRPRVSGWRRFGGFGTQLTITQLLPKLGEAGLMAAIGAIAGLTATGLFNRAERIVRLFDDAFLNGIKPVILPAFSRSLDRGVPAARIYLVKLEHLTAVSWPAFAAIGVMAAPIVAVVLGPGWEAAVPVVQALALMGVAKPFTAMSLKLFVALDRTPQILRIHAAHQALRLGLATAGALMSVEAAALGVAVALWVKAVVLSRAIKAATGYDGREFARLLGRSAIIAGCAVAGPCFAMTTDLSDLGRLVLGIASGGFGWLLAATILRHPLLSEAFLAVGAARPAAWLARR